jgi:hypothetical protein
LERHVRKVPISRYLSKRPQSYTSNSIAARLNQYHKQFRKSYAVKGCVDTNVWCRESVSRVFPVSPAPESPDFRPYSHTFRALAASEVLSHQGKLSESIVDWMRGCYLHRNTPFPPDPGIWDPNIARNFPMSSSLDSNLSLYSELY